MQPAEPAAIHVKLLTLAFRSALAAFDTQPLEAFLAGKELCTLREHVFAFQGVPHLLCVVSYRASAAATHTPAQRRPAVADLSPDERRTFDALRAWRTARARQDGVPTYIVLHDRELAEVVRRRPNSLAALGEIRGLGPAKLERYGAEVLATLHGGEADGRGDSVPVATNAEP